MPGGGHGRGQEGLLRFRLLASVLRAASLHFSRRRAQQASAIAVRGIGGRSHRYLTAAPSIAAARPVPATPPTPSNKALRSATMASSSSSSSSSEDSAARRKRKEKKRRKKEKKRRRKEEKNCLLYTSPSPRD